MRDHKTARTLLGKVPSRKPKLKMRKYIINYKCLEVQCLGKYLDLRRVRQWEY
jgi:hypothetical protein